MSLVLLLFTCFLFFFVSVSFNLALFRFRQECLEELVQKEGIPLSTYSTRNTVEAHAPLFVSIVSVEVEVFAVKVGKTMKHVETNAVKVAYNTLKVCKYLLFGSNSQFSVYELSLALLTILFLFIFTFVFLLRNDLCKSFEWFIL